MWYIHIATLFCCTLLISLSDSAGVNQDDTLEKQSNGESTNLVGFVSVGYDILEGNPEGSFDRGGIDPGFNLAQHIFKTTYDEGKQVTFQGSIIPIPDQMDYQPVSSCSSVEHAYTYSGTRSYQKKLSINIEASGSGSSGFTNYEFSLSLGYKHAEAATSAKDRVVLDKTVICNIGRIRYLYDTALNNHFSISNDFYYAVKNLDLAYNQDQYIAFIRKWGTNFIEAANLGGRLIYRYESSYAEFYRYASTETSTSASASGSYLGYSTSLKVDVDTFNEESSHTTTFGSLTSTVASGSTIEKVDNVWRIQLDDTSAAVPIHMTIRPITDALDPRLWTALPDGNETYNSLGIGTKLDNLIIALAEYPIARNAQESNQTLVRLPNAWPDGTYTLPKADSGCPESGKQFTWYSGWRYQDNEDSSNDNECEADHLKYNCGRNLKVHYCSKVQTSNDYNIKWPEGSYCIARKDGECPQGFTYGSVRWDDEDSSNDNARSGTLPDGHYTSNTRIRYCCRDDLHPFNSILLPTGEPFYLYRKHKDGCQEVKDMRVSAEYIYTDDDDSSNINDETGSYPYKAGGRNHKIYYCYYY